MNFITGMFHTIVANFPSAHEPIDTFVRSPKIQAQFYSPLRRALTVVNDALADELYDVGLEIQAERKRLKK